MKTYKRKGEWKYDPFWDNGRTGWARTHFRKSDGLILCMDGPADRGYGGASGLHHTHDVEHVTCKNCKRKLK